MYQEFEARMAYVHVYIAHVSSIMLMHSARALAAAGRNNYIPPAQESRFILPDGFSVGISGWSRDYSGSVHFSRKC